MVDTTQDFTIEYDFYNTKTPITIDLPQVVHSGNWVVSIAHASFTITSMRKDTGFISDTATKRNQNNTLLFFIFSGANKGETYNIFCSTPTNTKDKLGQQGNILGRIKIDSGGLLAVDTQIFGTFKNIEEEEISKTFGIISGQTTLQLSIQTPSGVYLPCEEDTGAPNVGAVYMLPAFDNQSTINPFIGSPVKIILKFSRIVNS